VAHFILRVGDILGLKKPLDFNSFLWPLMEELMQLELGVSAWDTAKEEHFDLQTYILMVFGDMPAIPMVMRMKGHNGLCLCCFCHICGIRTTNPDNTTHYVPLDCSWHPAAQGDNTVRSYDVLNLPNCTHNEFMDHAHEVQFAPLIGKCDNLAKLYSIKGVPVLSYLSSLSFPHSFPFGFMHLLWENLIPNLFLLWTSTFKGLSEGTGNFKIPKDMWTAAGKASEASGPTLLYTYGPSSPSVAADGVTWTADTCLFWALHVGLVVLKDRSPKWYYNHYIELVCLLRICLAFGMNQTHIATLRAGFASWVEKYEEYVTFCSARYFADDSVNRLYYQHDPSCVLTCPVTVQALLHLADSIEMMGPVWTS
jgi:hypothetical protein